MSNKRSVLCITSELPWPLDSGGRLRTFHMLRALASKFRVRVLAGSTNGDEDHVRALEHAGLIMRPVVMSRRKPLIEAARAARARLVRQPYVLYQRHNRSAMRSAIRAELKAEQPDVIYFDHLDSCVFADEVGQIPFVADFHNIYSLIAKREAEETSRSTLMRRYLNRESDLLKQVESAATRAAAAVFAVSEQERSYFSNIGSSAVHLVPNGVDCSKFAELPTGRTWTDPNVVFVGSLSWPPNVAAAQFLAREVHPRVLQRWPNARLTIVGRDPGPEVRALAAGQSVHLADNVPDITPYLADASLLAVPLATGGGTRLKILESFAAGLPVVSTPVGCEGIAAVDGRELIVAPANDFADAVIGLLGNPQLGRELAVRGRELARQQYDWSVVGSKALEAILSLLAQRERPLASSR